MFLVMEADSGLTALGSVFTQLMTWIGNLITTIIATPILLLPVGIFAVGAVIGLASRLLGK